MDNQSKKVAAMGFAAAFAHSLSESIAAATGSACLLSATDGPVAPSPKDTPVHVRLAFDGGLRGECFIEFYEPQILAIVSKVLKEPVTELTDEQCPVLLNIVSAAAEALAVSHSSKYGQLSCKADRVAGLAFGGMFVIPLAADEILPSSQILLYFASQLLDSLSGGLEPATGGEDQASKFAQRNLDLVMDVELNVLLRFGQRRLTLREVLELASGSVIELDKMVDEPVELYLDGKLIARGEAVVVDGNYGLRVTEIPQPVASHFLN